MQTQHRAKLRQAYDLIKGHNAMTARPLVLSVLKEDQSNLDAWWLAAYVAQSNQEKRAALGRVLKLDPQHHAAQELLHRLDQREKQPATPQQPDFLAPVPPPKRLHLDKHHAKRKIRWNVWGFRLVGFLCFWSVSLILLDNFLGGQFTKPIEDLLGIEPEAQGYVNEKQGGQNNPTSKQGIPITYQDTLKDYGDMEFGVIRKGEAHTYSFWANTGTELLIAANFTTGAASDVVALELWDSGGNLITREQDFTDLTSQIDTSLDARLASILTVRAIQFTVKRADTYTVAIISREGGPAGQYNLFVTTTDDILNQSYDSYLPDQFK